jgi:hypothetical protein
MKDHLDMTFSRLELTIYHTQGQYKYHYTNDAVET